MRTLRIAAAGLTFAVLVFAPAWPAEPPSAAPADPPSAAPAVPPGAVPEPDEARRAALEALLLKLRQAEGPPEARPIEAAILDLLSQSGSPSIDLLMQRAGTLLRDGDLDGSLILYGAVTGFAPAFAAGWRQRGIVQALRGLDGEAAGDLRRAVAIEPQDMAAWASLGRVLERTDDKAGALDAYRRALALDRHVLGLAARTKALETEVEGRAL